jgi:2-polyprenyl-6-methoxyphenol hydroxylase-like FAD-dependent oxidoreductase
MPASMRRRYEQLKAFPAGYLVFGDALSSFNPIYGQGMSVAALEAVALQAVLRHGTPDFTHRFFREAANIIDTAWSISAGNDLRMPEATGRRSAVVRLTNWYVPKLLRASHHDPELARAFLNVSNLMADPLSLMRPNVLAAVARAALRRPMSRTVRDTSAGG